MDSAFDACETCAKIYTETAIFYQRSQKLLFLYIKNREKKFPRNIESSLLL